MTKDGMLVIAQLYTANAAAAKQIVDSLPEDADIPDVRKACIAWIRSKEPDLFMDSLEPGEPVDLPEEIPDPESFCRDLDYEGRIVVLMKYGEGLNEADIARELGLPAETVKAYLQNIFRKNTVQPKPEEPKPQPAAQPEETKPQPVSQPEEKKPVVQKKPEKKKTHIKVPKSLGRKALSNKFVLAAIAVVVVVLGSLIGVRTYASSQYRAGQQYLQEEKYAEAAEALKNAIAWNGGGNNAILLLGDALYGTEEYEEAITQYEAYRDKMPNVDMTPRFRDAYRGAADKALKAGDEDTCVSWLDKEYGLTHDERTFYRKEAIRNGGTYTDVSGNIFNSFGEPVQLVNSKITLTLTYDADKLIKIDGVMKGRKGVTTLTADTKETRPHTLDVHWYPDGSNAVRYYAEDIVTDKGDIVKRTIRRSLEANRVYSYTYKYDGNKAISCIEEQPDGTKVNYTFGYDSNGRRNVRDASFADNSTPHHTTYDYDKDGHLTASTITQNIIEWLEKHTWTYRDGLLTEETLQRKKAYTRYSEEPMHDYRHIVYKNTSGGDPLQASLQDENGVTRADGWYIPGSGWIWLHTDIYE